MMSYELRVRSVTFFEMTASARLMVSYKLTITTLKFLFFYWVEDSGERGKGRSNLNERIMIFKDAKGMKIISKLRDAIPNSNLITIIFFKL